MGLSSVLIMSEQHTWYVLKVVSGQEKKIKAYIESEVERAGVSDSLGQILMPSERVYEMRAGKKRIKERNFFPGYIVLHADLTGSHVLSVITACPGVIGFLGTKEKEGRRPTPLRQQEINRILGKIDEFEEGVEHLEQYFAIGEEVKVMDGPFGGFTGTIEEINEEKRRLQVIVRIFGRNTPIDLTFTQVEKVS